MIVALDWTTSTHAVTLGRMENDWGDTGSGAGWAKGGQVTPTLKGAAEAANDELKPDPDPEDEADPDLEDQAE